MWTTFRVRFEFLNKLCAGIPANPELQKAWIDAVKPKHKPPQAKTIDEIQTEVFETTPEETRDEMTLHVFQRVNGGLAVGMRTIRGHIKDIAQTLSSLYIGKLKGERTFAVRAKNALYYPPEVYWVPIVRAVDGQPITAPTGTYDKPIHMMTPQGPRSALKTMEFIEGAAIEFPLWVLTQPKTKEFPAGRLVVSEADLTTLFRYGGVHGYGPERGDGEGKYGFTIKREREADDEV